VPLQGLAVVGAPQVSPAAAAPAPAAAICGGGVGGLSAAVLGLVAAGGGGGGGGGGGRGVIEPCLVRHVYRVKVRENEGRGEEGGLRTIHGYGIPTACA